MNSPQRLALASAAGLMSVSCDASRSIDPATTTANNAVIVANELRPQGAEQETPLSPGQAPNLPVKERVVPQQAPATNRPSPTAPAPAPVPPQREILPSPTQPPAEIDPVHPDPGNEVPL